MIAHKTLIRSMGSLAVTISCLVLFGAAGIGTAAAQWAPKQPVEIVVGFSPGGAVDRIARTLQRIFQDRRLVFSSVVVNKPGGAGNVGWAYLDQHEGDGHYIAVTTPTIMTNHITGRSQYNYTDFTPIAQFFTESVAFAVRADSPIRDWSDLMARMRKDPASVTLASSSREGAAPLTFAMAIKEARIDPKAMKLVVFASAGQAVIAAVGGHADVVLSIAETVKLQLRENRVRILAISAPKRPAEGPLAAVPTLIEQGVNVAFRSWRGVLGPRNMPPAQIAYWDDVFTKMVATEDWNKELALYDAANEYQNSAGSRAYLTAQYEQLKAILTELGLAKN